MAATEEVPEIPIIDSHIHLYPEAELESLAWYKPDSPLAGRRSLEEYAEATGAPRELRGFVFLETDRKNDNSKDWTAPLQEVAWLRRIIEGKPREGEGHSAEDAQMCLGIVPWAPMILGKDEMEKYITKVEDEAGPVAWPKIKGFRYLLQDKPDGTAVTPEFIESLKLLGRKGFVFDLGVDQHRRGKAQLLEAVDMIDEAHEGVPEDEKVVFIINHLCKPDLTVINTSSHPSFIAWRSAIFALSKSSKTYMKLSGAFSEMSDDLKTQSADDIMIAMMPWLSVLLAAFGPSRIMFGSDWPVCTVGMEADAWKKWLKVIRRMCYMATMSHEDQVMLFSGTAKKAYKLDDEAGGV